MMAHLSPMSFFLDHVAKYTATVTYQHKVTALEQSGHYIPRSLYNYLLFAVQNDDRSGFSEAMGRQPPRVNTNPGFRN